MNYHRHLPNIVNESCTPSASYLYRIDGKSALQLKARQLYYTHVTKQRSLVKIVYLQQLIRQHK